MQNSHHITVRRYSALPKACKAITAKKCQIGLGTAPLRYRKLAHKRGHIFRIAVRTELKTLASKSLLSDPDLDASANSFFVSSSTPLGAPWLNVKGGITATLRSPIIKLFLLDS